MSGRLLADICRSLPAKPVDVTLDGSRVSLTCGSARFSLQTMPVEDYPTLPDMPAATRHRAQRPVRARRGPGGHRRRPRRHAARCSPASAWRSPGSTIALLATDRFRLSHRELDWNPHSPDASLAALVPAKVLGDTAKSLTAGPEVTIALSAGGAGEGIIGFEGSAAGGTRRTTTRLLDGEFPKVRSLFPSEHLTTALVDKLALVESVKRVALVAERNTAVQLAFSDGVLTLDAGSGDEAQASESIEATVDGRRPDDRLQPAVPARRPDRHRRGRGRAVLHPGFQARGHQWFDRRRRARRRKDTGFRYLLMPRRLLS